MKIEQKPKNTANGPPFKPNRPEAKGPRANM